MKASRHRLWHVGMAACGVVAGAALAFSSLALLDRASWAALLLGVAMPIGLLIWAIVHARRQHRRLFLAFTIAFVISDVLSGLLLFVLIILALKSFT